MLEKFKLQSYEKLTVAEGIRHEISVDMTVAIERMCRFDVDVLFKFPGKHSSHVRLFSVVSNYSLGLSKSKNVSILLKRYTARYLGALKKLHSLSNHSCVSFLLGIFSTRFCSSTYMDCS